MPRRDIGKYQQLIYKSKIGHEVRLGRLQVLIIVEMKVKNATKIDSEKWKSMSLWQ